MGKHHFNFHTTIQMRWNDLDALGHVNNATYLTYFEIARSYFIMEVCPDWDWQKDMFLLANINVDFIHELRLTDKHVKVYVRTAHLGNKSFVLEYLLTSGEGETTKIHAKSTSTQVMIDLITKSTVSIPQWARAALIAFDGLDK